MYLDSAQVATHCDNRGTLFLSTDAGSTFTQVAYMDSWPTAMSYEVADVTCDTVLKMQCYDYGTVGGVIITVDYDGVEYSTSNPITDGYWQLISSSDGVTEPLVYSDKTSSPWYISTESIADDAVWVWNENTYNTMVFEFDFADLFGYSYIGCYSDTTTRALRYGPHEFGYDIDSCSIACANYEYFALQNNGWCCCDNDYDHAVMYGTATNCPDSRLGGYAANDLFQNLGIFVCIFLLSFDIMI